MGNGNGKGKGKRGEARGEGKGGGFIYTHFFVLFVLFACFVCVVRGGGIWRGVVELGARSGWETLGLPSRVEIYLIKLVFVEMLYGI